MVKEDKEGKWSTDFVLDLYLNLLMEIWEIVSALIGEAILALLFLDLEGNSVDIDGLPS